MLPQPILVSYEEKTIDDTVFSFSDNNFFKLYNDRYPESQIEELNQSKNYKKIIAGIPELPSIDFSALSEEDCKKIGWVDSEKLAVKECVCDTGDCVHVKSYIKGFKAAQSLNEKKFSEEDVIDAIKKARLNQEFPSTYEQWDNKSIIKSLSQPKVFDCLVEMEDAPNMDYKPSFGGAQDGPYNPMYIPSPKIANNSIKVLRVLQS